MIWLMIESGRRNNGNNDNIGNIGNNGNNDNNGNNGDNGPEHFFYLYFCISFTILVVYCRYIR